MMGLPSPEGSGSFRDRGRDRKRSIPSMLRSISPFRINIGTLSVKKPPKIPETQLKENIPFSKLPPLPPKKTKEDKSVTRTLSDPLVPAIESCTYSSNEDCSEEDLTCPICLDILYRPRQLSCGHSFCLLCLQNYVASCWNKIVCPSCRTRVELPSNGVLSLPRSRKLEKAVHSLRKSKEESANICQRCLETNYSFTCAHCNHKLCSKCGLTHLEELKNKILEMVESLDRAKTTMVSRSKQYDEDLLNLEKTITTKIEERIALLRQKETNLCTDLQNRRSKGTERVENVSRKISEFGQKLDGINELQDLDEFNSLMGEYKDLTSEALRREQGILLDERNLSLRACKSKTRRSRSFNGRLITNESNGIDKLLYSSNPQLIFKEKICERPAGIDVCPINGNLYICGSGSCKIFICDKSGNKVDSFGGRHPQSGGLLCPTALAFSKVSQEVFIIDKWKHCIMVFSYDGEFIRQIGREGKGYGQFCSPEGICTDDKGRIYVADTCNDRIQVLDNDGIFLHEIGIISAEKYGNGYQYVKREFWEPADVSVSSDGSRVYVADSGNHRIKVFDNNTGQRMLTLGSQGSSQGQFDSPECLCVTNGHILVGDSGNGRVQIFKPNGQLYRYLGVKNKCEGELGWVSGIATHCDESTLRIYTADFKHGFITAYQL